jgi:hypothetical protein
MKDFRALAAIFVLAGCANDPAITHIGQRASEYLLLDPVRLPSPTEDCRWDFVRFLPNGATAGFFRVPYGKALVVTDVDWQYVHPSGGAGANKLMTLRLFVQNLTDPIKDFRAFESTIVLSSEGHGGASEAMQSGFVVSSAARLCLDVNPGPEGPPSGLQHAIVRGYLVEVEEPFAPVRVPPTQ